MTNYFDEEDEQPSDDMQSEEADASDPGDFQRTSGRKEVDPLEELRQNLLAEEQSPQLSQPKPDLLRRMTGTLSSKKVPNKPKDSDQSGFGVRTAGSSKPAEPYSPREMPSISDLNTESLRPESIPGPSNSRWGQTAPFTPQPESFEDSSPSQQNVDPTAQESRVRPPMKRPLDPLWDGATPDSVEYQPESSEGQAARAADERKKLPSGFERQQQVSRFISYNPKRSLWVRFKELTQFEKLLSLVLLLAILAVGGLIGYLYVESRQPGVIQRIIAAPAITQTVVVGNPVPSGLHLPGGWFFQLGSGVIVDGKWSPSKSEWLVGTEVRRIIAIPWNKQVEAVVHTFEKGDLISLDMSNGDTLNYQVQSVISVLETDTSVLYDTRPSLAIILIQPDNPKRWVVIAAPQSQ